MQVFPTNNQQPIQQPQQQYQPQQQPIQQPVQQQVPQGQYFSQESFANQASAILDAVMNLGKEKGKVSAMENQNNQNQNNGNFFDSYLGKAVMIGGGGIIGALGYKFLNKGNNISSSDVENLLSGMSTLSKAGIGDIVSALFKK